MTDELQQALEDIARDLLILNYKIGCWYSLASADRDSQQTKDAGRILIADSATLHQKLKNIAQGDP